MNSSVNGSVLLRVSHCRNRHWQYEIIHTISREARTQTQKPGSMYLGTALSQCVAFVTHVLTTFHMELQFPLKKSSRHVSAGNVINSTVIEYSTSMIISTRM